MHTASTQVGKKALIYGLLYSLVATSVYLWWLGSYDFFTGTLPQRSIALGRLFGIFAQLMLLFQVVLVARIKILEDAFGFDRMNAVHRFTGFLVLVFLFSHPFFLVYGYAALNSASFGAQFMSFITDWHDVAGAVFALCLYVLIGFTSWHIIRYKLKYEHWYWVHFLTYIALIMAFDHQTKFATFGGDGFAPFFWKALMFGVVGAFLLYRWVHPIWLSRKHRFTVEKVVQEDGGATSVYISGRRMDEFLFEAGQYTSWRFHFGPLWRQFNTGFIFPHPFSFSQAFNGTNIRLTAKALGDYTKQLPQLEPGVRVTVSRPLGRFVLPHIDMSHGVDPSTKLLFIAGGIGITPLRALAEAAHGLTLTSTLLYGARTRSDFTLLSECKKFCAKVVCFASAETDTSPDYTVGIIDTAAILRECPDVRERHVYVCGPTGMMMSIVSQLKAIGLPDSQIHYEKFGY
jgi:predicted ferric reductase